MQVESYNVDSEVTSYKSDVEILILIGPGGGGEYHDVVFPSLSIGQ